MGCMPSHQMLDNSSFILSFEMRMERTRHIGLSRVTVWLKSDYDRVVTNR